MSSVGCLGTTHTLWRLRACRVLGCLETFWGILFFFVNAFSFLYYLLSNHFWFVAFLLLFFSFKLKMLRLLVKKSYTWSWVKTSYKTEYKYVWFFFKMCFVSKTKILTISINSILIHYFITYYILYTKKC